MTKIDKIREEVERKFIFHKNRGNEHDSSIEDVLWSILDFIDSLPKEPISKDLEEAATFYSNRFVFEGNIKAFKLGFIEGANWQKSNLWHDAQGDDLPEIDREVIVLQEFFQGMRKVGFAHRPNPNGWYGKSLGSSRVEHFEPKTYDKGGWNMKGVIYWLDAPLPEGIE